MPKISSRVILLPAVFAMFALYMVRTAHVDAAGDDCTPPKSRRLAVPLFPQETDNWCWAASAQMVKTFLFKKVNPTKDAQFSQCAAASDASGASCCPSSTSMEYGCDNGGWPNFRDQDFRSDNTWGQSPLPQSPPPSEPRAWETIRQEIGCHKRPFVFAWTDSEGFSGHMVVVRGYSGRNGAQLIQINDSLPRVTGSTYWESYDYYRGQASNAHTHWGDFYDIEYIGP